MERLILAGFALVFVAAAPPRQAALRPYAILKGDGEDANCLAFSPDGKFLAIGSRGYVHKPQRRWGKIAVWDLRARKVQSRWEGHEDTPIALAFSPDGKAIVSVDRELECIHWDMATGKGKRTYPGIKGDYDSSVSVHLAGKLFGGGSRNRGGLLWDAVSAKELFRHEKNFDGWGSDLSPDRRLVAGPNHQDVDLWDVRTGKLVRSLEEHPGQVNGLSFCADGRLLAVGCNRWTDDDRHMGEVWLWDPASGRRIRTIPLGNLYCGYVALSPSGDLLAVAGGLDLHGPVELRLFDTASGGELARVRARAVRWIQQVVFRADGNMLAACCGAAVRLWSVQRPAAPDVKRDRK